MIGIRRFIINIGIILQHLLPSQLNFLTIKYLNGLSSKHGIDCSIFYEQCTPIFASLKFGIYNISEIAHAKGLIIATNLNQASYLTDLTNNTTKIFYVWDLEFLRHSKNFLDNVKIYRNKSIRLITRNNDYAKILENYCNRPVDAVIDQFNLVDIINIGVKWT